MHHISIKNDVIVRRTKEMPNCIPKKFSLKIHIFNCGSGWLYSYLGSIIKFYPYFSIRQLKMKRTIFNIHE